MGQEQASFTPAVQLLEDPERVSVILNPARSRLFLALREERDSAAGLARKLGEPRQRVNYHLRALEKAGFVELHEERRKGNCTERILRVSARHYLIDPEALGVLATGPDELQDRFSAAYVMALASHAVRELAALQSKAASERKRLATLGIQTKIRLGAPADFAAFERDLRRALQRVMAKHHHEGSAAGRSFTLFLGMYPAKTGRNR